MTSEAKSQALVRVDPQALLTRAVENNATIETLERLVALAKDMKSEQARAAWFEAMSEFQSSCPDIRKTSQAEIATARGSYRYKYAELPDIMAAVKPLMRTLGLSVFWSTRVEPGKVVANCRVAHVLGHVEESGEVAMPVPDASERGGGNPLQRVGSALSYARRYSLMAILGIAPEDDDDGQSAGRKPTTSKDAAPTDVTPPPDNPPAGTVPSPAEQNEQAVREWIADLEGADSAEKLKALWHTLTQKNVWACFNADGQARLREAKDSAKVRLTPSEPAAA